MENGRCVQLTVKFTPVNQLVLPSDLPTHIDSKITTKINDLQWELDITKFILKLVQCAFSFTSIAKVKSNCVLIRFQKNEMNIVRSQKNLNTLFQGISFELELKWLKYPLP